MVSPAYAIVGNTDSSLALVLFNGGSEGQLGLLELLSILDTQISGPAREDSLRNLLKVDQLGASRGGHKIDQEDMVIQKFDPNRPFPKKCLSTAVVDVSFNGTLFAAAGSTVLTWDVIKQTRTAVARLSAPDLAAACSWLLPQLAVSAGAACGVSFWDTRVGTKKVHLVKVAKDNLYALKAAENGVYAAGADGKVYQIDLRALKKEEIDFGDLGAVVGMASGDQLAVVFESGAVRMAANGVREATFCGEGMGAKSRVGCATEDLVVAVGQENGVVKVWKGEDKGREIVVGTLAVPCLEFWDGDLVGALGDTVWRVPNGRGVL